MNRNFVLFALAAALVAGGCNDLCNQGITLKTRLQSLETEVGGTLVSPSLVTKNCQDFRNNWVLFLSQSSSFASQVAQNQFTRPNSVCIHSHYERKCEWHPDPYQPGGGSTVCHSLYVCDLFHTEPGQQDGYEEAMELSSLLSSASAGIVLACDAHDAGHDAEALIKFAAVKSEAHTGAEDADYVLNKAGCYNRTGD